MAAKAKPETSTARIRYSRAITLASEYLGDAEFVERDILTGLAAGDIPWWCERFEAPPQYSGPRAGDPKFWKVDPDKLCTSDGPVVILRTRGVHIKGDSAKRIDGAAAFGIDLGQSALVRRKLLPPSDVAGDRSSARKRRKTFAGPKPKRAKSDGPAIRRIRQDLLKLFPPDGRVPDHNATEKICARIEAECGWKPSWDSVARALRRRED